MSKSGPRIRPERLAEARRTFGANLRRRRVGSGLTQAALAERVGIEPQSLQRLELGRGAPSFALMVAIADVLEVRIGVLFREVATLTKTRVGRPPVRSR